MVTSAGNEQGFELRQHGDRSVELVDFDGFALIGRATVETATTDPAA